MGMFNTQRMQMNQPIQASPTGYGAAPPIQAPQQTSPGRIGGNPRYGLQGTSIRAPGAGGVSYRNEYNNQMQSPDAGGVVAGGQIGQQNAVQQAYQQGPSLEQIQAEMARRNVGVQLNQNPGNSAVAGYMFG